MKGFILTVTIDDDLFMLEFFRHIRLGVARMNKESGKAFALILGIWKLETNITFVWRKTLDWHEIGQA